MSGTIIETKDLTKIYDGKVKAVDKLNISIEEGEIYGLLGPNGAGKTTTIKMLTTALKPTSGTATISGFDIVKDSMKLRRIIGMVPQDLTTDDDLKGWENMSMVSQFYDMPKREAEEQIESLLKLVDLSDASDRYVKEYSGGMRKRLDLAVGLIHSPKILFLDEPTLGLDVQTRTIMWDYISSIRKKTGVTIILTSHYLEEVDALADRMSIIDKGKIVITGTSADLKRSLKGDIVSIEFSTDEEGKRLQKYPDGVEEPETKGNEVRITVANSESSLPKIFDYMVKEKITPKSISVHKPSLDQVFIKYTGRTIREAEGGEDVRKATMNIRRMRR